jgi:predicted amidohydrolase YtcJ
VPGRKRASRYDPRERKIFTADAAQPSEAISRERAVVAYTLGSAYAEFEEDRKGSLAEGMLADIAVLSQDIFTVPPPALPGTESVLTIIGGEIVYDAGVLEVNRD